MTFPQVILPLKVALQLGATWTDVSSDVYMRSLPVIQRGRADETTTASPQTLALQLNNRSGNYSPRNPSGSHYGSLPLRNAPIRAGVTSPSVYLRFADDNTSYASAPDSAGLQITGDLDVRWFGKLDHHGASLLVSKWGINPVTSAWALTLNGDGTLTFRWSDSTHVISVTSTAGIPVPLGAVLIRATLTAASGTVTFYTGSAMGAGTQLGAAGTGSIATGAQAAAGTAVQVGANSGFAASFGVPGSLGEVYEVQILSGIGGTTKADPVFTAQTAGASSFADAQSNTWTMNGTAELSAISYRFHGQVSSLPQNWDTSGADVWAPLTAAGQLRQLQQQPQPLLPAWDRAVKNLMTNLVAWWPCEDGASATEIASAIPGAPPMQFTAGAPSLAADSSFACCNPLPVGNSSTWRGPVPTYTAGTSWAVTFLIKPTAADMTALAAVMNIYLTGTAAVVTVTLDAGSIVAAAASPAGAALATTTTTGATSYTGRLLAVRVSVAVSGGTCTLTLEVMPAGTGALTADISTATYAGSNGQVTSIMVSPTNTNLILSAPLTTSVIGQVAVTNAVAPDVTAYSAALVANAGETAGNRFARLCAENGLDCRIYGYPSLSAAMGPQVAATLTTLLQECETADGGLMFESRRAVAVGYRTLKSMQNQAAVSLSYTSAHLGQDSSTSLNPTDDDAYTVNSVQVARGSAAGASAGSSVTATLADGSAMSTTVIGTYASQVTANLYVDGQLGDAAGWRLHRGTDGEERYPQVPVNLARSEVSALVWQLAAMDIGDYLAITSPPAWLPPGPVKQLVYGYSETLGSYAWQLMLNCVPETPLEVGIVGDAVYGHADTDGSQLHANITNSATTMQVDITGASGDLWSTSGSFPFDIMMGGEQITVGAISGSSTPQTFSSLTRSVNGVVKAHTAGEAISLAFPAIVAIA